MGDLRARIAALADALPDGASVTLPASELRKWLAGDGQGTSPSIDGQADTSWRARLWTVPADMRLGVHEVAEALGRGRDFVYRAASPKAEHRLPSQKIGGELMFTVRDVRAWIEGQDRPAALRVTR